MRTDKEKRDIVDRLLDLNIQITQAILDDDLDIAKILKDKISYQLTIYIYK